ncbi:MAG: hypothetical protein HY695_06930 [Deltaproteobacteria bacterium]|nr:hypothetical protein [Deltaproteobacteria bacterium]
MRPINNRLKFLRFLSFFCLSYGCFLSGSSIAQTPYYQGKTITILRGGEPGGSGDMQARALIPYLRKYIPGEPTVIIQNMPGAGGRKAANYVYSGAKPDGLTIGAVGGGLVVGPILGLPGVKYDLEKLTYLGSTESGDPYVFYTSTQARLNSLEKLSAASGIRIGTQAVGSPIYFSGRLFAYLLDLKAPRFVPGYSGPELDLAVLRGEVDARANSADTVVERNREALEKGLIHIHATITIPKGRYHPRFSNVPDLESFARNDPERDLVRLYRAFLYPRWPYFLPPGTPQELVRILREAMTKTFEDPDFPKEFRKLMGGNPSPLTGQEMERAIRELPRHAQVIDAFNKLAGSGPLPPRQ